MNQRLLLTFILCFFTWAIHAQIDPITSVNLQFEANDGAMITATATDGGSGLAVDGDISLLESTAYTLTITLFNGTTDITSQVTTNADQLQLFFDASEGLLADVPSYNDMDANMLPLGLSSSLTGNCVFEMDLTGTFRIALKDLGDQKSVNSTIDDGTALFDLSWNITIADDVNAPACENEEEEIDRVTLTFAPVNGGDTVVAVAADPDGPGPMGLVAGEIDLLESTEYQLSIMLENTAEGEDITEEVRAENDEHLFLFAFSEDIFDSPDGDGNIDNIVDPINYADMDDNSLPVGLLTNWTTACTGGHAHGEEEAEAGVDTFRVVLKHQPGMKTATSGFDVGGTDIDITWEIHLMEDPDAPACENEEEEINQVTLTFAPVNGGDTVVAVAADPDGPGPIGLVAGEIDLLESTEYQLSIMLENTAEGEDITEEIREEDDEHLFLFGFSEDVFDDPDGDGNIDNVADPINYDDMDDNGLPVGLLTSWTTACTGGHDHGEEEGEEDVDFFRVVLKHQPGQKTATSGFDVGGTDIDITWDIHLMEDPDAPECENEEEVIDKVTLTFTSADGSDVVVAEAIDPDGPGPMDLVTETVSLEENTEYELSITLENTEEGEDITEEIREEDDEHMFFFAWTGDIFSQPMGDGNIDNRADPVNYNDSDDNNLPVGLSTNWTTNAAMSSGTLRVVLKHQPGIKSDTSTAEDGGTDLDIIWNINSVVTSTNNLRPDQRLTIAPNPVRDNLYFLTRNIDLNEATVMIFNSVGARVKTLSNISSEINISNLAPGMYTVQVRGEQLRWNGRFVKTNN